MSSLSGVRVAYVAGWGRSGSTLLGRMLGQLPRAVFVGESRDLWLKGGIEDRTCGCGDVFSTCTFWTAVGDAAFGGWRHVDFDELVRLRAVTDRPWSAPLTGSPGLSSRYRRALDRYVDVLGALFQAFRDVTGADLVVDSSKVPSFAMLLARMPSVDLRVVHLVRDSRGSAYSWEKRMPRRDRPGSTATMLRYGSAASAARYTGYNAQTQLLRTYGLPYVRLRYEDLVDQPGPHVERVARHVGARADGAALSFLDGRTVLLGPHHAVAANPGRLDVGPMELRVDDAWKTRMSPRSRRMVTTITAPVLAAYGYPLTARCVRRS